VNAGSVAIAALFALVVAEHGANAQTTQTPVQDGNAVQSQIDQNATDQCKALGKEFVPAKSPAPTGVSGNGKPFFLTGECVGGEPETVSRSAIAGHEVRLDYFYAMHPDCTLESIPNVVVKVQPAHGTVRAENGEVYSAYPPTNIRYACNLRKSSGVTVIYTPTPGYTGSDELEISAIFSNGQTITHKYKMDIVGNAILPPTHTAISTPASDGQASTAEIALPPPPIGIPHTCDGYYPPDLARAGVQGATKVAFRITADGTVKDVIIAQSSGNKELDYFAGYCVIHWKYKPAMQNGVPVEVSWMANVVWKIPAPIVIVTPPAVAPNAVSSSTPPPDSPADH